MQANYHFAPTENAAKALLKENVSTENIYVTGNTVIDALWMIINSNDCLKDNLKMNDHKIVLVL